MTEPKAPKSPKSTKVNYTYAVGRRKTAVARVRLYGKQSVPGSESVQLVVNNKSAEIYFSGEHNKSRYRLPFILTDTLTKMSASAVVIGGGKSAQLGAVVHGIARALAIVDRDAYRGILKKAGLITRDSRAKERRKVGTGGKARRAKQSPKR